MLNMKSVWFGLIWSALMALCTGVSLWQSGWHLDGAFLQAWLPCAIGALLAGTWTRHFITGRFGRLIPTQRFAAIFIILAASTIVATIVIFSIQHRSMLLNVDAGSSVIKYLVATFFDIGAVVYLFLALGLRLYLPWGVVALVVTAALLSRGYPVKAR